ncbi:MAG: protein kinase [Bryobacteraceae bacterium]
MPLSTGELRGPYEILAPIGAGGMGEVYRARDTRLNRVVAIKISKEQFTERFEREAHAVAALNHPNICTLYDVGPDYLVMEYVEGPTLAERIAAGAIPLDEALPLARQIAEALEAAHEKGIVHRDLKPANIKLTGEGKVKVLDFGLAKAFESGEPDADPSNSPTVTLSATRAGVILGTAGYMSPEQARGVAADKRADIWSFGVVLFEMLTGRRAFAGETISDTLAAVLKTDPDWSALPAGTPPPIRRLLRRCLEKDRKKRLHDIADARLEIDEAPEPQAGDRRRHGWLPWGIAAFFVASTAWLALAPFGSRSPEGSFQVALLPPEKASFTPVEVNTGGMALSPDGRALAFVATLEGKTLLWVRRLDSLTARPLPGTDGAYLPFWSPDSRFIGFFAGNKLKKIEVAGGPPQDICDAGQGRGGTWNRDGVIVFTAIDRTIRRVRAAGGEPVKLTTLDPAYHENAHYWPDFLPDGRHFLYLARSTVREKSAICVGSIDDQPGTRRRNELVKVNSNGVYGPSLGGGLWGGRAGWLLFLRERTLFAQKFDAVNLKLEGEAVPVAERVGYVVNTAFAAFSVSDTGLLVYGHESNQVGHLIWMSRDGKPSPAVAEPGDYFAPRLSPDGTRLAVGIADAQTGNFNIWQIDLPHGITTRFTFQSARDVYPVWSPDGKQIVFSSLRDGAPNLYLKAAGGAGNEERIGSPSNNVQLPYDWSRDGRYLLYTEHAPGTNDDLWVLPMTGERKPVPLLQTQFDETQGQFSPDGRWVAYISDESNRYEVYVRSFNGPPGKFQISSGGGTEPRWRGDGKELYYVSSDGKMMAAAVKATADGFERETPRVLFEARALSGGGGNFFYHYDVARDGQRFLIVAPTEESTAQPLTLVTNWQAGLKK